jgi:WD40 repeat protein
MQQITKEYKKRQKNSEEESGTFQLSHLFVNNNPFETSFLDFSFSELKVSDFLELRDRKIMVNSSQVVIPALESYSESNVSIINTCGRSNCLAFSFGSPSFLCVSICKHPVQFGHIYSAPGVIQVWEIKNVPVFCYSFVHNGFTALDLKFFPCKFNSGIGTLAACLANGDLPVYNLPIVKDKSERILLVQPFAVFRIEGLVFSSIAWTDDYSISAGSQDGSIFIFRPGYPAHTKLFEAHRLPITSISYVPACKSVVSTGLDGHVKVWDLQGHLKDSLCLSKRWNYHISCNPTGHYIFFDNDAAVSPHKIAELKSGKLESKKQISQSTEATLCSCFSPISNFDYVVTAEGFIELIYVSELEKNSKKRKTPWNRYCRLVYIDDFGNVRFGENLKEEAAKGSICWVDLCNTEKCEFLAWAGVVTGIYNVEIEDIVAVE